MDVLPVSPPGNSCVLQQRIPEDSSIHLVKIKGTIFAKPLEFETTLTSPSQIFSVMLLLFDHQHISAKNSLVFKS